MWVKPRWPVWLMALMLTALMGCQALPAQQSIVADAPAVSSEPSSAVEIWAGAPEAVPEPTQPVAKPVEVPVVLPESSEAEPGPKAESQSAPAVTVLPSPETVVWLVEKQVFSLSEIAKDPWRAGSMIGYFENNSTEQVTLSIETQLEYDDGENWVQVKYSSDDRLNLPTGNGPTLPGERFELGGVPLGLYVDNLVPGQYRWVKWIDSSYSEGVDFEAFCIYAAFELA